MAPGVDGRAYSMAQRVVAEGGARALWRGTAAMTIVVPMQNALLFAGTGSHSSTFRLNVSALCGTGGAFRCCLGGIQEVLGGIMGC